MLAIMSAWMVWHDVESLDDPSPGRATGAGWLPVTMSARHGEAQAHTFSHG